MTSIVLVMLRRHRIRQMYRLPRPPLPPPPPPPPPITTKEEWLDWVAHHDCDLVRLDEGNERLLTPLREKRFVLETKDIDTIPVRLFSIRVFLLLLVNGFCTIKHPHMRYMIERAFDEYFYHTGEQEGVWGDDWGPTSDIARCLIENPPYFRPFVWYCIVCEHGDKKVLMHSILDEALRWNEALLEALWDPKVLTRITRLFPKATKKGRLTPFGKEIQTVWLPKLIGRLPSMKAKVAASISPFKEELLAVAWNPDRACDWCLDCEERQRWTVSEKIEPAAYL